MAERSYRMDIDTFEASTETLTLEQEGAFLRLSHHSIGRSKPVREDLSHLGRLWDCHPNKARKLLAVLIDAGLVSRISGGLAVSRRHVGRSTLPEEIRRFVFDRDGLVCSYCRVEHGPFEIDHILAVCRGGGDHPDNLCVVCSPCNRSKGSKLIEEWL